MLILRIFGGLLIAALGISLTLFIATGDKRWLRFAALSLKLTLAIFLIILVFFVFERIVVVN
jgi:hypothetical protein